MAYERWGAVSVCDHKKIDGLLSNILLYHRLVIPVPRCADAAEEAREIDLWRANDWDPDLLSRRLTILGSLAVPNPWNDDREKKRSNLAEQWKDLNADADDIVEEVVK